MTTLIAIFLAYIAFQQFRLQRERFKLDLFDKRFVVFEAARALLLKMGDVDDNLHREVQTFSLKTADAGFLFDDDVTDYLDKIRKNAIRLWVLTRKVENGRLGEKERASAIEEEAELLQWAGSQSDEMKIVFYPYMKFYKWKVTFSHAMFASYRDKASYVINRWNESLKAEIARRWKKV